MPAVWIATLETRHFSFMAAGETREVARRAMMRGWETHREETGAEYAWTDIADDVSVLEIMPGECMRDGRLL